MWVYVGVKPKECRMTPHVNTGGKTQCVGLGDVFCSTGALQVGKHVITSFCEPNNCVIYLEVAFSRQL